MAADSAREEEAPAMGKDKAAVAGKARARAASAVDKAVDKARAASEADKAVDKARVASAAGKARVKEASEARAWAAPDNKDPA